MVHVRHSFLCRYKSGCSWSHRTIAIAKQHGNRPHLDTLLEDAGPPSAPPPGWSKPTPTLNLRDILDVDNVPSRRIHQLPRRWCASLTRFAATASRTPDLPAKDVAQVMWPHHTRAQYLV